MIGSLRLCLLALLVLLATVGTVILVGTLREKRRQETLDALLAAADAALAGGREAEAEAALVRAAGLGSGAEARLRILKRVHTLCRSRGDYEPLADWAASDKRKVVRDPALLRLALYAALRADRKETVAELLADRRAGRLVRSDADLQQLAAEAVLRGLAAREEVHLYPELEALVSRKRGVHPQDLMELGRASGDGRYFLDAALLWMQRGEARNASAILKAHLPGSFHEPAAYISYDAGDGDEAERRAAFLVRNQPGNADLRRFYGDILFQNRRYDLARDMYLQALQQEAGADWRTILNLAAALERAGDSPSARVYTSRAHAEFPETRDVLIRYAAGLAREGRSGQAAALLAGYLERHPEQDPEMRLLALTIGRDRLSAARYEAELWKLYNRFPANERLARVLTEYLLSAADLRAAGLAIAQHEAAAAPVLAAPWLLEATAVLDALKGDLTAAEARQREKVESAESWQSRYNLAVILGASDRYAAGVEELMAAESLLSPPGVSSSAYRSRIRSKLGEFYAALGDAASARRELGYALELDPGNLQPRLLLKKLEEVYEK